MQFAHITQDFLIFLVFCRFSKGFSSYSTKSEGWEWRLQSSRFVHGIDHTEKNRDIYKVSWALVAARPCKAWRRPPISEQRKSIRLKIKWTRPVVLWEDLRGLRLKTVIKSLIPGSEHGLKQNLKVFGIQTASTAILRGELIPQPPQCHLLPQKDQTEDEFIEQDQILCLDQLKKLLLHRISTTERLQCNPNSTQSLKGQYKLSSSLLFSRNTLMQCNTYRISLSGLSGSERH